MARPILALLVLLLSTWARAEGQPNEAPFGLVWGMSNSQAKSLGVELTEVPGKDNGISFSATKLPKVLSDAQAVFLSFGLNDRLWRMAVMSKDFQNDPAGNSVISRYNELKQLLAEKCGSGKSFERIEKGYDGNYFMLGISSGNSQWFTDFKTDDLQIQLGIIGSSNEAHWRLIIEQRALEKEFEAGKKANEKDAL
jgi:hypothetical protein